VHNADFLMGSIRFDNSLPPVLSSSPGKGHFKVPNLRPGSYAKLPGNEREDSVSNDAGMDVVERKIAKGTSENGLLTITVERDSGLKNMTVKIEGKPCASFQSDKNGVVTLNVREQDNIILTGDVGTASRRASEFESAWLEDEGTNWKIEDDSVLFTYPKTNQTLSLPKISPGRYCPKDTFPVYGQPEMIFALAMGMKFNRHTILSGPTGTGKTTAYQFIAELLGYNFVRIQIDPKTEGAGLIGEYLPAGTGTFEWTDGPLTEAVRMSQTHPTIVVFDELSRIGNVAELARTYSLLDDGRMLTLPERRHELGDTEIIHAGELYIGATLNPADDEGADYIGVRELDPALMSRFSFAPLIKYPPRDVEIKTLLNRVEDLSETHAHLMVDIGTAIRESEVVHYPFSFRELIAWAEAIPYYGFNDAAKVAFINKAHPLYRPDLITRVEMSGAK
jgi:MoxR-like ATPase